MRALPLPSRSKATYQRPSAYARPCSFPLGTANCRGKVYPAPWATEAMVRTPTAVPSSVARARRLRMVRTLLLGHPSSARPRHEGRDGRCQVPDRLDPPAARGGCPALQGVRLPQAARWRTLLDGGVVDDAVDRRDARADRPDLRSGDRRGNDAGRGGHVRPPELPVRDGRVRRLGAGGPACRPRQLQALLYPRHRPDDVLLAADRRQPHRSVAVPGGSASSSRRVTGPRRRPGGASASTLTPL